MSYIGAVDNNYKDPDSVTEPYVANALDAIISGVKPPAEFTKAIGCTIKVE